MMEIDVLGFTVGLAESIVTGGFTAFILYLFRNRIISRIKRAYHWISNSPGNIYLKRVDKYDHKLDKGLGHDVFKHANENIGDLTLKEVGDNRLRVKFETKYEKVLVDVHLEKNIEVRDDVSGLNTASQGGTSPEYRVVVETVPSVTFGYQNFDSLEKFRNVSEELVNSVQAICFDGQQSDETLAIGEMQTKAPPKSDRIDDKELGMTAEYMDSTVYMDFKNPKNMVRGIKRYFTPLQIR